ncbi:Testis-expressed sequence 10 protein [Chytriomyces hyalinus]|nr:Testis-expressed sequence 10 protein [Chytriomyces hyalinus]
MAKKKEKDFKATTPSSSLSVSKKKLKVGGLKDQGNETNVSFKSKRIVVPSQSVADHDTDNASDANMKRNLDLRNTLSMLSHFSAPNRKDALARLKDLVSDEWRVVVLHMNQVISAVAPLLLDREFEVRRGLVQFAKVLVKMIPSTFLLPFVPVVVTYSCSAMNHIVNEIRFDAVRFMNVWIDVFPESFAASASQIIQNYMSLLNLKKQKVSGKDQYIKKSKDAMMDSDQLTVLSSLNQLLRLSGQNSPIAQSTQPSMHSLYFRHDITVTRNVGRWAQKANWKLDIFSIPIGGTTASQPASGRIELSLGETTVSAKPAAVVWGPKDYLEAIVPACTDVWLEASPLVLSGVMINENSALEKLHLAMSILHQSLLSNIECLSESERKSMIQSFAKHILVSFPYGHNAVGIKTENCERILQEMSIKTCEIVSLFQKELLVSAQQDENWEEAMYEYMFKTLAAKGDLLPLQSLKMIFPLCASTIKDSLRGSDLIEVLVRKHKETPPKTAMWVEMFHFIRRAFSRINPNVNDKVKSEWISYLPRALWSLSASNASVSKDILCYLSEVLRSVSKQTEASMLINNNILNGLVPFFHVVTPQKGPIYGPFLLLPVECQKSAVELLFYLPIWSPKLLNALASCLTCPAMEITISSRALEITIERQNHAATRLDWDAFYGLIFTVGIIGMTSSAATSIDKQSNLLSYADLVDAVSEDMSGDLLEKCEAVKTREVEFIQRRVYLAQMSARALLQHSSNSLDALRFVFDAFEALQDTFKTLDSYIGLCTVIVSIAGHGVVLQSEDVDSVLVKSLPSLCSLGLLMALKQSSENYELFKSCADATVKVLACIQPAKHEFIGIMRDAVPSLSQVQRERVHMILGRI